MPNFQFYFFESKTKILAAKSANFRFLILDKTQKNLHKTAKKTSRFREVFIYFELNTSDYKEAECTNKSANLLEYPISLSYHETTFTNCGESMIPASLSNTEVLFSPTKS